MSVRIYGMMSDDHDGSDHYRLWNKVVPPSKVMNDLAVYNVKSITMYGYPLTKELMNVISSHKMLENLSIDNSWISKEEELIDFFADLKHLKHLELIGLKKTDSIVKILLSLQNDRVNINTD